MHSKLKAEVNKTILAHKESITLASFRRHCNQGALSLYGRSLSGLAECTDPAPLSISKDDNPSFKNAI